jgi:regulatory LuxR family protein
VLALVAEGLSNKTIAERLFVAERAVETHIKQIFMKLRLDPSADTHRRVLVVLASLAQRPRRRRSPRKPESSPAAVRREALHVIHTVVAPREHGRLVADALGDRLVAEHLRDLHDRLHHLLVDDVVSAGAPDVDSPSRLRRSVPSSCFWGYGLLMQVARELYTGLDPELAEGLAQVVVDGAGADEQA